MRADVTTELTVIRAWRDAQAPSEARDAMVAGFLWALALVGDLDVSDLRDRLDGPRPGLAVAAARAPAPEESPGAVVAKPPVVAWPDPETAPPWRGLGIERIVRSRPAGDGPVAPARAFTAGPDGRPVALASSYAEMAAESLGLTRDLSDDSGTPETGAHVLSDTTT